MTKLTIRGDFHQVMKIISRMFSPAVSPMPLIFGEEKKIPEMYKTLWDVSEKIDGNFPIVQFEEDGTPVKVEYFSHSGNSSLIWEKCLIKITYKSCSGLDRFTDRWTSFFWSIGGFGDEKMVRETLQISHS